MIKDPGLTTASELAVTVGVSICFHVRAKKISNSESIRKIQQAGWDDHFLNTFPLNLRKIRLSAKHFFIFVSIGTNVNYSRIFVDRGRDKRNIGFRI